MAIMIVDSGSTKTDWFVGNGGSDRRIQTQGINPFHQTDDEIRAIFDTELLPQLGEDRHVDSVWFYGSGCRAAAAERLRTLLTAALCCDTIEVASDMLGAARALCGHAEGIACILGTGSNSCLYDGRRIVDNTPSLGYILGDEGGGAMLGRTLLNALYKGRLPETLRRDFESELQLTLEDVIERVYRRPLANRFLASLAPFIARHADAAGVSEMVTGCFREFLVRNVRPYGRPDLRVGFVGSIAAHFGSQLTVAVEAEGMKSGAVMASPMDGLRAYHGC